MSAAALRRADAAGPAIALRLAVEDERWRLALPDFEALTGRALAVLAVHAGLEPGDTSELGVTLADDAAVRVLNAQWRGKDKPTNVLSFPIRALVPGQAPGPMLGDLVLALETLEREAQADNKPLSHHFSHLVVHGTLHCLGYDHEADEDADAMEALEVAVLGALGIPDPYREFDRLEEPIGA